MAKFRYPAVSVQQTNTGPAVVLFGAPAHAINRWAGVPQKKALESTETVGFQRELSDSRLEQLRQFLSNNQNTVQNPLLCATRDTGCGTVSLVPASDSDHWGWVEIDDGDLGSKSLLQLLEMVKAELEERVPTLQNKTPPAKLVADIKRRAAGVSASPTGSSLTAPGEPGADIPAESETDQDDPGADADPEVLGAILTDESHIRAFWEDVAARVRVLQDHGGAFSADSLAGFSRDAMESLLRPVVVVDGQHRLMGAVEDARARANAADQQNWIAEQVDAGRSPEDVASELQERLSRRLLVSLLLCPDPAEHVFQFVVVNQRATPIGKALLGTIVSTTLSSEELTRVASRLEDAKIPLEDSRSINFMAKQPSSPFCGKVERGLSRDRGDLLPWTVMGGLIRVFRFLKEGKLYGMNPDHTKQWRRRCLDDSPLVARYAAAGYSTPYEYWCSANGPWRQAFIAFWSETRDLLGNTTDADAKNYWGSARQSQLFNMISLQILTADFFRYLTGAGQRLESPEQVREATRDWLGDVDRGYFSRDWKLSGVKKESSGIRKQWAKLWSEYREAPDRLPQITNYRKPLGG
jgi:hypothetical protein